MQTPRLLCDRRRAEELPDARSNSPLIMFVMANAMAGEESNHTSIYPIGDPKHTDGWFFDTKSCWFAKKVDKKYVRDMKNRCREATTKDCLPFKIWTFRKRTILSIDSASPQTLCASQERPLAISSIPTISTRGSLGWWRGMMVLMRSAMEWLWKNRVVEICQITKSNQNPTVVEAS